MDLSDSLRQKLLCGSIHWVLKLYDLGLHCDLVIPGVKCCGPQCVQVVLASHMHNYICLCVVQGKSSIR